MRWMSSGRRVGQNIVCSLVEQSLGAVRPYLVVVGGRTPYQSLEGSKLLGNMLQFGSMAMRRVLGTVQDRPKQEWW